jgi:hypothetical protein
MDFKYIYHHLGLGDHIICNGLIRKLINPNEKYIMFVKSHNLHSVKFMYRDLSNLSFIEGDDSFAINFINKNKISEPNLIKIGFWRHPNSKSFDESFYMQKNVSFDCRWDDFFITRDFDTEELLYKKFDIKKNEYIFIHDDTNRNYIIDEKYIINKNLKLVRPILGLTNNIFDYCKIIENSIEAHFIDSSFKLMCDSLSLKKERIFYHLKLSNNVKRNLDEFDNSISKLNFEIIK